ncbi:unnamed protein product [Leptosia nina]|uniref:FLYWCH-type domain-containing protein n=1 Tax=Leptosia nina TaxID=320188 RepID=A0AAV1J481_9NEOP
MFAVNVVTAIDGATLLMLNSYSFSNPSPTPGGERWYCSGRIPWKCCVCLHVNDDYEFVSISGEHCHLPPAYEITSGVILVTMTSGNKILIINGHTFRKEISVNGATSRWCCNEPTTKEWEETRKKYSVYLEAEDDVILFLETQNGRTIMQYGGYQYNKAHKTKLGERWNCTISTCSGHVVLNEDNEIITDTIDHDHRPLCSEPISKNNSEDNDSALVITSRKGKEMLLYRNFTYRKQYDKGNKSRWVCSTQKNCKAVVFTDSNNVLVSVHQKHHHDPPKYYLNPNHVLDALREPLVLESD